MMKKVETECRIVEEFGIARINR